MTKPKESITPASPAPKVTRKPPTPILSTSGNLLALNENEGRWLSAITVPYDNGWFAFDRDGNPPFYTPVEVQLFLTTFERVELATAWRTPEIGQDGKEKWIVFT